jgi:hypothetical protein
MTCTESMIVVAFFSFLAGGVIGILAAGLCKAAKRGDDPMSKK